jgi:hypothetical protein
MRLARETKVRKLGVTVNEGPISRCIQPCIDCTRRCKQRSIVHGIEFVWSRFQVPIRADWPEVLWLDPEEAHMKRREPIETQFNLREADSIASIVVSSRIEILEHECPSPRLLLDADGARYATAVTAVQCMLAVPGSLDFVGT